VFESLVNFRDVGGRPVAGGGSVRTGRLFRSDSVAYASVDDARRMVEELGLATVIDLRGEREVARRGRGPLADLPLRYLHVPIADVAAGNGDLARYYTAVLHERGDAIAALVRWLLHAGALPAVVHCEAGCDRTGIVAAVVLGLVGVPDEAICADYDLTEAALPAMNARWRRDYLATNPELPPEWIDETWDDRLAAMERTAVAVRDEWGGWGGWAAAYGLIPAEVARLRDLLVVAPRARGAAR
jgi:protein-tyrosine phosphatase